MLSKEIVGLRQTGEATANGQYDGRLAEMDRQIKNKDIRIMQLETELSRIASVLQ